MVTTQLSEEDTLLDSVVEEVAVEEVEVGAAPAQGGNRSSRSKSGSKTTVLPAVVMTDEGGGMRAALVFTALILVFAIPFAIGMITGHPTGITQGVVDMFAN